MDIFGHRYKNDEFIDANSLTEKQLVYQNKPKDTKWMSIFGELETDSCKSKNLLLIMY